MSYDQTDVQYDQYSDSDGQGDGLISIQGRHGNPEAKSGFHFFLGKANVPDGYTPGAPWEAGQEFIKQKGEWVDGWKCDALAMRIICVRAQPFEKDKDGRRLRWVEQWPKNAPANSHAMHCDVLMIASGIEDLGPVKWVSNGSAISFAIVAGKGKEQPQGGILERIRSEVLTVADQLSPKGRAKAKVYWAFWITIAGQVDSKGKTVYTKTPSGGVITLPAPVLPEVVDKKWLIDNYAGPEADLEGKQLRAEWELWRSTRMTDEPQAPGRNVPEEIEEDSAPF
jgi:hypothetical protein